MKFLPEGSGAHIRFLDDDIQPAAGMKISSAAADRGGFSLVSTQGSDKNGTVMKIDQDESQAPQFQEPQEPAEQTSLHDSLVGIAYDEVPTGMSPPPLPLLSLSRLFFGFPIYSGIIHVAGQHC